ncbi:MAG: glycosyltransferase family 4 protein [Flavobacteriales bacterium]|nr:glycosyltransferase family 4 protein [Flavobacteriales bacterium]
MRIALIHYRLVRNGGLETRLLNYMRYFAERGHETTVIVCKVDSSIELPQGVRVHRVDLDLVPKPLRLYFLDRALRSIIPEGKFDLSLSMGRTSHQDMVLCPGTHLGYLAALQKRWWNPMDLLNVWMDRWAFANSRMILAASGMMADEMELLYGVGAEKIRVLNPPTDVGRFNSSGKKQKAEWRDRHGFSTNVPSILFMTTGNKLKGYAFVLELMRSLLNEPVELIVAGMKPMDTDLPNVRFVGYAQHPQELYWAADMLIVPSVYEAFGQVVTESLQCGTPVLASHMVGAKDLIAPETGMVMQGFDIAEWTSSILEMISRSWDIPEDFAEAHSLTTAQHCDRVLATAEEMRAA